MTGFICTSCDYGSESWFGRCPSCGNWNTLIKKAEEKKANKNDIKPIRLLAFSQFTPVKKPRMVTGIFEFDRVIGGGFIAGEVLLISGEPGIGKSTILLKSLEKLRVAYISGEESGEQFVDRARRLHIDLSHFYFSQETQVESIIAGLEKSKAKFDIVVIDSIQTIFSGENSSGAGRVGQVRETVSRLVDYAKKNSVPVIIVGHITKDGEIAGPKTLEHLVDCVLFLEGDRLSQFRILRSLKNRFGSTDEVGVFEMRSNGLVEVKKSTAFLEEKSRKIAGRVIVGIVEGSRTLFFEVQCLVVPTALAVPRRLVAGLDYNRVQLLLAVIRKNIHLSLDRFDIYVNVVGGLSVRSTAADLGVMVSVISSVKNIPVNADSVFVGEIGLLGEVRHVVGEEKIIKEAMRYGFKTVYSSKNVASVSALKKLFFD